MSPWLVKCWKSVWAFTQTKNMTRIHLWLIVKSGDGLAWEHEWMLTVYNIVQWVPQNGKMVTIYVRYTQFTLHSIQYIHPIPRYCKPLSFHMSLWTYSSELADRPQDNTKHSFACHDLSFCAIYFIFLRDLALLVLHLVSQCGENRTRFSVIEPRARENAVFCLSWPQFLSDQRHIS